jgi:hypothetical protein
MLDSSMIFLPIAARISVGHSGAGFGEPAGEAAIDSHILSQIPELAGGQARFSRLVFSDGSRQRRREGARGLQKAIWKAVREGIRRVAEARGTFFASFHNGRKLLTGRGAH